MDSDDYEILIVEDSPNDAELMIRSFKKHRLANSLVVLEDGELALDYIFCTGKYSERNPLILPKVIFLDLKLPKVHGLEVLEQLKSNNKTKSIPVVIVTSSREDPDIKHAYELGANSYVVKPVDFDQFSTAISQLGLYWLVVNEDHR
ncbi:MAG: response regulator [Mariprofundaceae bacterium]|nr:response regulator [Mariprofundaceae bacterium]